MAFSLVASGPTVQQARSLAVLRSSGHRALPGQLKSRSPRRAGDAGSRRVSLRKGVPAAVAEVAAEAPSAPSTSSGAWIPLIPVETLPKGERRLVKAEAETVLLLWYKNEVFAVENCSPAEGAYSEGLFNARLSQDGSIICPLTDSTFDLKTGEIKDWYPNNPMMRFLTRPVRQLAVYPVKIEDGQICINMGGESGGEAAELVFARTKRAGETATDVVADEIRMIIDEDAEGFGFTAKNELLNGRAAMTGFFLLIIIELVTGKGLLGATGFLDFLYSVSGKGL